MGTLTAVRIAAGSRSGDKYQNISDLFPPPHRKSADAPRGLRPAENDETRAGYANRRMARRHPSDIGRQFDRVDWQPWGVDRVDGDQLEPASQRTALA